MAWSISQYHSLRSGACQASSAMRAPGRSARPMLVNAATGSAKNITPKQLIHTS
jgi:hypothetical protein